MVISMKARRISRWGPQAWYVTVSQTATIKTPGGYETRPMTSDVGHAFAFTEGGACRKAQRIMRRIIREQQWESQSIKRTLNEDGS